MASPPIVKDKQHSAVVPTRHRFNLIIVVCIIYIYEINIVALHGDKICLRP